MACLLYWSWVILSSVRVSIGSLICWPCTNLLSLTVNLKFYFWHFLGTQGTSCTYFGFSIAERSVMCTFNLFNLFLILCWVEIVVDWWGFHWEYGRSLLNDLSHASYVKREFMWAVQNSGTHLVIDHLLGLDLSNWNLSIWTAWEACQGRLCRLKCLRIIHSFCDLRFGYCEFSGRCFCSNANHTVRYLVDRSLNWVNLLENTCIAFSFYEWIRILFVNINVQVFSMLLCLFHCLGCKPFMFTISLWIFSEICQIFL